MGWMGGGVVVLVNAGAVDQESDDKIFTLCVCARARSNIMAILQQTEPYDIFYFSGHCAFFGGGGAVEVCPG